MRFVLLVSVLLAVCHGFVLPSTTTGLYDLDSLHRRSSRNDESSGSIFERDVIKRSAVQIWGSIQQSAFVSRYASTESRARVVAQCRGLAKQSLKEYQQGSLFLLENLFSIRLLRCDIPAFIISKLVVTFLNVADSKALNLAIWRLLQSVAVICDTYFYTCHDVIFGKGVGNNMPLLPSFREEVIYRVIPTALTPSTNEKFRRRWDTGASLLFGFSHLTNHFDVGAGVLAMRNSLYPALFQSFFAFFMARHLYSPLYRKHGFAAALSAHFTWNSVVRIVPSILWAPETWALHVILIRWMWKNQKQTANDNPTEWKGYKVWWGKARSWLNTQRGN